MTTPNDFTSERDDGVNALPIDAQRLYTLLERDGADWQTSVAPAVERVTQQLGARIAHLHAGRMPADALGVFAPPTVPPGVYAPPASESPASAPPASESPASAPSLSAPSLSAPRVIEPRITLPASVRSGRMRRWATTGVTVAIVLAFLAVLGLNAAHRPGGASSQQTSTGASSVPATSAPASARWVDLHSLDYATEFSANDPPAIAPSNPRIVYETMAQGLQQRLPATMRVTTNGGATWRTLATPVPAAHIGYAGIAVSPVDPQTVFLSLIDTTASECPANRLESGEGSWQFCRMEYTSTDGGASWSATGLPLAGGSKPGLLTASINSGMAGPIQSNTARAQGQRLFAGFLCTDFSCQRLVTSVDGGRDWSFADQALLAHGAANVCDYTLSATGATVFAVTTTATCDFRSQAPLTLWRSGDAGATWTKVTRLATPNERGMALAQNPTTGATLLYMGMPRTASLAKDKMGGTYAVFSQSPSDVRVSSDGGVTWRTAPTKGIPAGYVAFLQLGLLGTLKDGSVVIDVIPPSTAQPGDESNFDGSDLYAWTPGDAGWRKIGSVPREIDSLLVTPSQSGPGETVYTVLVNRSGAGPDTYVFLKMDLK